MDKNSRIMLRKFDKYMILKNGLQQEKVKCCQKFNFQNLPEYPNVIRLNISSI